MGIARKSKEKNRNSLGKRIAAARQAAAMSRRELAELLGVDPTTVTGWELGKYLPREGEHRRKLATALKIDLDDSQGLAGSRPHKNGTVRLVDPIEDFPARLVQLLERARHTVKDVRLAAPYTLPPNVQTEFRRLIAARILEGSIEVQRIEIFYSLARLQEVLANILAYHGCKYHVRSFCPGLTEVVPAIGAYAFDDESVFLGGYWSSVPPHNRPGLLLHGAAIREFFRAYWDEAWRRGTPMNLGGADDLSNVRSLALQMGLTSSDWPSFLEQARGLTCPDSAPLRI